MKSALLLAIAVLPVIAGCASSNRTQNERFKIESTPDNALATLSTGETCLTPCHFDLPRADDFSVTISKEGYRPYTRKIRSVKSETGGSPVSTSVSLGGIISVPVGPQTGSSYDLEPNPLVVELTLKR
ncbi:MAG: PEGA domain-containing protein [Gammaproteobacteria bacterium]